MTIGARKKSYARGKLRIRQEVAQYLEDFRQGYIEFPATVQALKLQFESLKENERPAFFKALSANYSSESFKGRRTAKTVVIRIWAELGFQNDLVELVFAGIDWTNKIIARSWTDNSGSQFLATVWAFRVRFSERELKNIKAQCRSIIRSRGPAYLTGLAKELGDRVERIKAERRALKYRMITQNAHVAAVPPTASWPVNQSGSAVPHELSQRHYRKRAIRNEARVPRSPSEKRADTVARLIQELNEIVPDMRDERDYTKLAAKYPRFLSFKIARKHEGLREKLENIQQHGQHIRLAQEIAAAKSGNKLSTIQTDWKKHKPISYRRQVYKQLQVTPKIPKNPQ